MTLSTSAYPTGLEDCPPLPAPAFQVAAGCLQHKPLSYLTIRSQLERAFFWGGRGKWGCTVQHVGS